MKNSDEITLRQLMAMVFVGILSPAIRLLPGRTAGFAGKASWLSVPVAVIPVALAVLTVWALLRGRQAGQGLTEALQTVLGKLPGGALCAVYGLWLMFYAGFTLRIVSERMVSAVYETGSPAVFAAGTLALASLGAFGGLRALGRTAQASAIILIAVLTLVLVCALGNFRAENLLPVTFKDAPGVLMGAIPPANIMSAGVYFAFLMGRVQKRPRALRPVMAALLVSDLSLFLITAVTVGVLSPELVARARNPFFIMIRNISFMEVVERIEALVITLWIITDFVYIAALMAISAEIFSRLTGKSRKTFAPLIIASAAVSAAVFGLGELSLLRWSQTIVPVVNMALVSLPLLFALAVKGLRALFARKKPSRKKL